MEKNNSSNASQQRDMLARTYSNYQQKPWGVCSVIEGFYHIGNITPIASSLPNRPQAIADCYWKEFDGDIFTTVVFQIPLGPLFNASSVGPNITMADMLGEVIFIKSLKTYRKGEKNMFSIEWQLARMEFFAPDDILLDEQRSTEEDQILLDIELSEHLQESVVMSNEDSVED